MQRDNNGAVMRLEFLDRYKTIVKLPIEKLPDITILTGVNGCGKTHFLRAIEQGKIVADGIASNSIKYHDWTSLSHAEANQGAWAPGDERQSWNQISGFLGDGRTQLKAQLQQANLPVVAAMTMSELRKALYSGSEDLSGEEREILKSIMQKITGDSAFARRYDGIPLLVTAYEAQWKESILLCEEDTFLATPPMSIDDPFQASLSAAFVWYARRRIMNQFDEFLVKHKGENRSFLEQADFRKLYGQPPWEIVNELLKNRRLEFQITEPPSVPGQIFVAQLRKNGTDEQIAFTELSSGERILIGLALFMYSSDHLPTRPPKLLLLDEVDAPLHPSMTTTLIETVKEVAQKYATKVILASHAPSTVALAPADWIYVMDAHTGQISHKAQNAAVRELTAGVPVLSVEVANRRQAFVEDQYDVSYYDRITEICQSRIRPEISISYIPAGNSDGGAGVGAVKRIVNALIDAGDTRIFGIMDWDGKNTPHSRLLVLGGGRRRSVENYIFDPILIAALLLKGKNRVPRDF